MRTPCSRCLKQAWKPLIQQGQVTHHIENALHSKYHSTRLKNHITDRSKDHLPMPPRNPDREEEEKTPIGGWLLTPTIDLRQNYESLLLSSHALIAFSWQLTRNLILPPFFICFHRILLSFSLGSWTRTSSTAFLICSFTTSFASA